MKHMNKLLVAALGLLLVLGPASAVQATTFCWDFENVDVGTYNSLTYTNGWFSMTLYRNNNVDFEISDLSFAADASWGSRTVDPFNSVDPGNSNFFILTFSHAVSDIWVDYSDGLGSDEDLAGLEAYDASYSFLGDDWQVWPSTSGFPDYGTLSLGGVGNMSYVFFGTSGTDTYPNSLYFDNICVNAVPEPGTIALLGLGLAGVAARRRRNRKS